MNTLEQAARQALEALSRSKLMDDNHFYCYAAATALRHALDQQKREPVAWWNPRKDTVSCDPVHRHRPDCTPLYTEPPQRKPLTRDQALKIVAANPDAMTAIRMTEAAHGIKE